MAEAVAVHSAVMLAAVSSIRSLTVLSDSKVFISMLKTKASRSALFWILVDIYHFSSVFGTCNFLFIPRLLNSEADLVAKSALAFADSSPSIGV